MTLSPPSIKIEQHRKSRLELLEDASTDESLRASMASADVVLLPSTHEGKPLFPSDTVEIFRDLQAALPEARVEIAVRDEDYQERLLHSILIDLGSILVKYVLIPVIPNVLWDLVKKRTGILTDSKTRVCLLIAPQNDDDPIVSIEYEGSSEDFHKLFGTETLDRLKIHFKLPPGETQRTETAAEDEPRDS